MLKNRFFFRRVFILFLPEKDDLMNTIQVTIYKELSFFNKFKFSISLNPDGVNLIFEIFQATIYQD